MSAESELRYGWTNHIELGANSSYKWIEYGADNSREIISFSFGARWRSYDYDPKSGPGWQTDSPFDITYGSLLDRGQTYVTLLVIPPQLGTSLPSTNPELFSFGQLKWSSTTGLAASSSVGLGWDTELNMRGDYRFVRGSSDRYNLWVTIRKRIFDKFDASLEYEHRKPTRRAGLSHLEIRLRAFL